MMGNTKIATFGRDVISVPANCESDTTPHYIVCARQDYERAYVDTLQAAG